MATVVAAVTAVLVTPHIAGAAATTVVVPNSLASTEANENNAFPFNCLAFGASSMRTQQVYRGTEVGSSTITQLAFRPDGTASASAFGPTTISSVTIKLSTTTKAVDGLSATFADNVGADVQTVFSGNLTLSSANTGGPPRNFDIVIPL